MKEEVLQRLDALAAALKTTSEHIWLILVQRGVLEGYLALFWVLLVIPVVWSGIKQCDIGLKMCSSHATEGQGIARTALGVIVSIVGLIVFGTNLPHALLIANPEFYALQEILKVLQ